MTGCEVRVWSDPWAGARACGKPVKGTLANGQPACGAHLGAEKAQATRNAKAQARQAEMDNHAEMIRRRCDDLSERVGVPVGPMFVTEPGSWKLRLSGRHAVVAFDDLETLASRSPR